MLDPSETVGILDEVARGNRDAFRRIVRAYSLPLRSYLASQTHNLDDVEDLAQEVFLAAFRNLAAFRRGDDLGAWLRGIARNKLHDHWRRTSRRERAMEAFREEVGRAIEADLERVASADRSDAIEALLRCISRLPEKLRRVVRGGLDGDKPAALAEALATSVAGVYNLHYRANQLLRDCVRKEWADGPGPA
jgi:RNA polymerase sigma-70 factor (ECF subfamily)